MKIKVKCSYIIEIETTTDLDYVYFDIEQNHCPGTGLVGEAFDKNYEESNEKNVCWACNLQGKNEIIEVDGRKI